jgi:raffinose/stachyose/melibiose transport system substrate-binding protein
LANKTTRTVVKAVALAAAATLALAGCSSKSGGTGDASKATGDFKVWWYEKDTAMATTWAAALEELKANHPKVTVKFELKTWDQIQKAGNAILDSDQAPDLAEWNKGNATAGSASQAGLLTNLDAYAKKYGWDTKLPESALLYGRYTDGLMGKGSIYGLSTYGEYVSWFYNKDYFTANGLTAPTTPAELDTLLAALKAKGQTMALGGAGYQIVHLAYALALTNADQQWVKDFQFFANPVDFTAAGKEWGYAAAKIADWKSKGYFNDKVSGISPDDAVAAFESGKNPLILGGTWLDDGIQKATVGFDWGKFQNPGNLSVGSAGNLLVIPSKSKQKDLAAEFIDMILSTKYQNMLGNNGGLPLLADQTALTNPVTVKSYAVFDNIVKNNQLGMYPDWPVPGYYEVQLAAGTKLLSDGDAASYLKTIGDFYEQNKP